MRHEKTFEQLQRDKAVAKSYYSRAFWTSCAPALILLSILCGSIGRNGGDPVAWFMQHWVINLLWLACIMGLLCFAAVEIAQGVRRASKYVDISSKYTTRILQGPRREGSYTAEISKNGIPCGYVEVGSISSLIKKGK